MSNFRTLAATTALALLLTACHHPQSDDSGIDLRTRPVRNKIANIPPQCFTRTQDVANSAVQNPCYVCHADADQPNWQSQPENQLSYAFPSIGQTGVVHNDWKNFFVDRRDAIAATGDDAILAYVRQDNYHDARGHIDLAQRLRAVPKRWDLDGDGQWDGYIPDAAFSFDAEGFDRSADGAATGWRAFTYYPFPGTFMPTNGAFDDVLIRLPAAFREDRDGKADAAVYKTNLAIVESLVRRTDIAIDATDERALDADLDRDGTLGTATHVVYDWAPLKQQFMYYVGRAGDEQRAGRVQAAAGLFPVGTEFLHSVRYLDVGDDGVVRPAARMKELRYSRKQRWETYSSLRLQALDEEKEATLSPDEPEQYYGDPERGMKSKLGWVYQGYIEDRGGRLRPQTQEESQFCLGCHGGLSATDDTVFSYSRKRGGATQGWGHWSGAASDARPFANWADPKRADGQAEYASYLLANHAGDEYRANDEVRARFFDDDGQPRDAAFAALAGDLSSLMLPSAARALALNKAYLAVVREQSYALGRDPMLQPAQNVLREVKQDLPTGIATALPAPRLAP
ncbi:hypothetical protein [Solimonas marina]|uniref:Lipoprotein n=1 Tax=Solimonas marina TaxID=2714601 RepID=A0A969WCS4_9GAMM|nr:hypothetical protein [Solimonas marina]NKF22455.1 hypothetical protein [Solimonas marina]